jgi:hypothetical protein
VKNAVLWNVAYSITSKKMAFFIVTAMKTLNLPMYVISCNCSCCILLLLSDLHPLEVILHEKNEQRRTLEKVRRT